MKLASWMLVAMTMMSAFPAVAGLAFEKAEETNEASVLDAACPTSAAPGILTSGAPIAGTLPAVSGAACHFKLALDGAHEAVKAKLTGLPADFDLYVRMAGPPTTASYDCRPYTGGTNSEHCTVLASSSTAFIMVRRFTGSGDFTIEAADHTIPVLNDGPATVDVPTGSMEIFKLNVAAGSTLASATLAGDSCRKVDGATPPGTVDPCTELVRNGLASPATDADLYVRVGALPTTLATGSSCRVVAAGTTSACVYNDALAGAGPSPDPSVQTRAFAGAGTYYVGVRGTSGFTSGVVAGAVA